MKSKQITALAVAVCFTLAGLGTGALAQTPAPPPAAKLIKVTVVGKIVYEKSLNRYFVREKMPREVLFILNQNPEVLDKYVRSGKEVTIEARSAFGDDNLVIDKIDGKKYEGVQNNPKGQK